MKNTLKVLVALISIMIWTELVWSREGVLTESSTWLGVVVITLISLIVELALNSKFRQPS